VIGKESKLQLPTVHTDMIRIASGVMCDSKNSPPRAEVCQTCPRYQA
jgi:hypothetical protein